MKILILDDDPERHEGFAARLRGYKHEVVHAWTISEFLRVLTVHCDAPFDAVCLDHDLEGRPDHDRALGQALTGLDAAKLLRDMDLCPDLVYIHSWNRPGADNMHAVLKAPGRKIVVEPYGGKRTAAVLRALGVRCSTTGT